MSRVWFYSRSIFRPDTNLDFKFFQPIRCIYWISSFRPLYIIISTNCPDPIFWSVVLDEIPILIDRSLSHKSGPIWEMGSSLTSKKGLLNVKLCHLYCCRIWFSKSISNKHLYRILLACEWWCMSRYLSRDTRIWTKYKHVHLLL